MNQLVEILKSCAGNWAFWIFLAVIIIVCTFRKAIEERIKSMKEAGGKDWWVKFIEPETKRIEEVSKEQNLYDITEKNINYEAYSNLLDDYARMLLLSIVFVENPVKEYLKKGITKVFKGHAKMVLNKLKSERPDYERTKNLEEFFNMVNSSTFERSV
jgi:hypothetical protein